MMKFLVLLLFSPVVFCVQRYRKSTNPNDEPFLPIHPEYPYNPKLMKRGIEPTSPPQQHRPTQAQSLAQLSPELYAPKVDARDAYTAGYSQSSPYYAASAYEPYVKSAATSGALTASPYLSSLSSAYGSSPYGLLNSYAGPYAGSAPAAYGTAGGLGAAAPGAYGVAPYGAAAAAAAYPNYYYQPPYYYPNYYNQPPYGPPLPTPPGYPSGPYKPKDGDDDDEEDEKRRVKSKKPIKTRLRDFDREAVNNQYVDGGNFIISSAKDLDGESSTHRSPSTYNHIEDSDVHPRTVVLPKATYRLVSVSGQQPDYAPTGYIKIQQLENLMRQALAKLLAQNAAQQASLAQIQEAAQQANKNGQYINAPNTIAKTGLSYVVNPTILNRVTSGQYNPSQLLNTLGNKQKTSVSLQQSPGIYIPPAKSNADQSPPSDYDYEVADGVTSRNPPSISNYQSTAEPTRNYPYSTYQPTPQTSLDDVNFGNKQKNKS